MMQGYFRFDWTLFKNGQPYRSETQIYDLRGATALDYQNYTYVKDFFKLPTDAGVYDHGRNADGRVVAETASRVLSCLIRRSIRP